MNVSRNGFISIAVLALLAGVLGMPGTTQAQRDLVLTPSALTVRAGQTMTCVGSGFDDELVAYWATAPDLSVLGGGREAAVDGKVVLDFAVPRDAISGRWAVTAYGLESKTPVVATFDVIGQAPDTTVPAAGVEPRVAAAGATLSFHATGFRKHEHISWWVTAPDTAIRDAGPEAVKADSKGVIAFRWSLPADAKPGRWVMTMQGYDSGVARAIAFEVR
jgi:hypothetical protein